ncbi:iron transporter [Lachnospiraceae bacterium MD1]|uniref:Iron transporter n=1 Tax=Variimorphobacter saccharofermentans TaxID=2755051 RepID=A0A839JWF7_9FIRM|nr:iron transporter [Variimorphobacter saccharofermentans]MBB2181716.1 iron transporter [Variimorphobacter saccharofermentans]
MKRKLITIFSILLLVCSLICGCTDKNNVQESSIKEDAPATESPVNTESEEPPAQNAIAEEEEKAVIPDGIYKADFDTDSSMFHVSEACDGKGILTVKNGEMTIHISLMSKKIVNLYPGLAEDAEKDGAELLIPTEDKVTFSDGLTEEVYGFDVPVPVLEEEFDLALVGTKGTWYDHKVKVSNPEPMEEEAQAENTLQLEDGIYTVDLAFEGGSGKAKVLSPATVTVSGENVTATIQWSSPNYDYMLVDGEKYLPINTEGDSVFEIPVLFFDKPMDVVGDTVAMSTPHEIEYTLTFYSDTMKPAE